jgi:surface antigen
MRKLNANGFAHWVLPLIVLVLIGAIGGYIYHQRSGAVTTALSYEQCKLLGRDFVVSSHTCRSHCLPDAGIIQYAPVYDYCSNAVAWGPSHADCDSKNRKWAASGGCTRHWTGTVGGTYKGALQCKGNSTSGGDKVYHKISGIDYCTGYSSSSPSGTGSNFVGPDGFGSGQCTDYVKYILARHSSKYNGGSLGDGQYVAHNLGNYGYNVNHTPAIHATVSFPAGFHSNATFGHVGLVAAKHSDGSIEVEESNYNNYLHYGHHTVAAGDVSHLTYAHTEVGWH